VTSYQDALVFVCVVIEIRLKGILPFFTTVISQRTTKMLRLQLLCLQSAQHSTGCLVVCFPGMTSLLVKVNKSSGAHFQRLFSKIVLFLMFLNIQIDLIMLKRYDEQFTLTTKKIIAYLL